MPKWLSNILITLLVLLISVTGGGYFYLKSIGIIPKADYETIAPELPAFTRPAVLVFNKTNGFRHKDAIPVANEVFAKLITAQGWDVFITDNAAVHNPESLQQFQLLIWNNVSGDVLTDTQRDALQQWLHDGGGWLGVHAAGGDRSYKWHWYVESLIGAQFIGHTMEPQFQDADLLIAKPLVTATAHLATPWRVKNEEWYAFDANPRDKGYEILLTIDENSYDPKGKTSWGMVDSMEGEHPMVWRHHYGEGRVFYSAIGHQPETYQLPEYQQLLTQAMRWAIGENN